MIHIKYVTRALISYPWLPHMTPESMLWNFQIRNVLPWQSEWHWFWISSCGGIWIRGEWQILATLRFSRWSARGRLGAGQRWSRYTVCGLHVGRGVPELCSGAGMFPLMPLFWFHFWVLFFPDSITETRRAFYKRKNCIDSERSVYPWDTIVLWNELTLL